MRLRRDLAKHYQIHESNITAWVLGEHGNSSFVAWSLTISGLSLDQYNHAMNCQICDKQAIVDEVQKRALRIFATRGYTDHGIGALALIGKKGIEKILNVPLSSEELESYQKSAQVLQNALKGIES